MAVDPVHIYTMCQSLASGLLELSEYFPDEWDGGDPGYLASGLCEDAQWVISVLGDPKS